MSGKEILMEQIQDVRYQLTLSEEARLLCESKNGSLVEKLSKQEMRQHLFKENLRRVENRIQNNECVCCHHRLHVLHFVLCSIHLSIHTCTCIALNISLFCFGSTLT